MFNKITILVFAVLFLIFGYCLTRDNGGYSHQVEPYIGQVVRIENRVMFNGETEEKVLTGTGFVIDPHTILTAKHVLVVHEVPVATPFGVFLKKVHIVKQRVFAITEEDGYFMAHLIDKIHTDGADIAVLQTKDTLKCVPVAYGREPKVGEMLITFGCPYNDKGAFARAGICSRVGRHYIFTDIRIIPGYSGGPLFAIRGRRVELVGIMTGMIVAYGLQDVSVAWKMEGK